jgi:hypothetical protein
VGSIALCIRHEPSKRLNASDPLAKTSASATFKWAEDFNIEAPGFSEFARDNYALMSLRRRHDRSILVDGSERRCIDTAVAAARHDLGPLRWQASRISLQRALAPSTGHWFMARHPAKPADDQWIQRGSRPAAALWACCRSITQSGSKQVRLLSRAAWRSACGMSPIWSFVLSIIANHQRLSQSNETASASTRSRRSGLRFRRRIRSTLCCNRPSSSCLNSAR